MKKDDAIAYARRRLLEGASTAELLGEVEALRKREKFRSPARHVVHEAVVSLAAELDLDDETRAAWALSSFKELYQRALAAAEFSAAVRALVEYSKLARIEDAVRDAAAKREERASAEPAAEPQGKGTLAGLALRVIEGNRHARTR